MADAPQGTPSPSSPSSSAAVQEEASPSTLLSSSRQRSTRLRKHRIFYGLLVALLLLALPYVWRLWMYYRTHISTDNAYVAGDILPLSPQVAGTVLAIYVEEHQAVHVGQVLVQLDPREFDVRVKQAEAAMAMATAHVQQAKLEVPLMQESTESNTARTSASLRGANIAVQEARSNVEEAAAHLRTLQAAAATAQAESDAAASRLDIAEREAERMRRLLADGVIAQQQADTAASTLKTAQAQWRASQQRLRQAQAEVERMRADMQTRQQAIERARARMAEAQASLAGSQAQHQHVDIKQVQVDMALAALQQAQANLEFARLQLSYTALKAPVAGRIARKRVEVGQVVQVGRPLLAIVPLDNIWVEANFKETQLQYIRPGQKAILHIDAYPDQQFTGTVESISPGTGSVFSLLPPENATGNFVKVVQRIPIRIHLDSPQNSQIIVRPGMSVIATIDLQ